SPLASSTGLFSPADVVFELFDGLLLVRDDCLDQVPDGNDADESSFIDNGQVANPLFSYGVHALVNRLAAGGRDDVGRHDFTHFRSIGGTSFEDDFSCVISFGEYPGEAIAVHDH